MRFFHFFVTHTNLTISSFVGKQFFLAFITNMERNKGRYIETLKDYWQLGSIISATYKATSLKLNSLEISKFILRISLR